jgi:hypothetical protein
VPSVGATGAWSTHASKIAAFQGGAWQYYTPEVGTRMHIVSRSAFYWWNGTALTAEVTSGGGGSVLTVAGHAPDLSGDVALVVADITGAAPLSSPAFTGTPTAPTRPTNNNSTGLATTEYVDRAITALGGISSVAAGTGIGVGYSGGVYTVSVTGSYASTSYVDTAIANLVNSAPGTMDTLGEIATLLAADESTASALATTVAGKVAKAGDTMTGDLHLSVPGSSDNTDKATSTSWVRTYVTSLGFGTGSGTITNVTAGTGLSGGGSSGSVTISADTTVLATHSYVTGLGYATLASPTFTGTVTIPAGATISGFAPLASPTFTGTVTIPAGASISGFAPLASPTFTGTPAAPTATAGTNTTQLATTAFVQAAAATAGAVTSVATRTGAVTLAVADVSGAAPLASPTFTGTPAAPTPLTADNSTTLATTAFVKAQGYGLGSGTVTSVDLSMPALFSVSGNPVTTIGTLAVALANQTANTVLAGPTTGSPATPTMRALVAADLPGASAILDVISSTRGTILYRGSTAWSALAPGTSGNVLQTNGAGADPTWVTPTTGSGAAADIQTFTANGTWTKPSGAKMVKVVLFGGGASGGSGCGGAAGTIRCPGSGGGGGDHAELSFLATDLASTVTITVGAGGASVAGGSSAAGSNGNAGGDTSFGTRLLAYGGGKGALGGTTSTNFGGGSGGGAGSAGNTAASSTIAGGLPGGPTTNIASGGQGAGAAAGAAGWPAEYGGGSGGGFAGSTASGAAGGGSLYGGAGGGSGGGLTVANAANSAGKGGSRGAYNSTGSAVAGTGGSAAAGAAGTAGDMAVGGGGGAGGDSNASGTGGAGGSGGANGGGGGGGGGGTSVGGASGAGGAGAAYIITYF